jgi:hypothetical protein
MLKYMIISSLFALSFSEDKMPPDENIQNLGKGWYEATAWVAYHEDITKSQAKDIAIKRALKKIIEDYSGIEVSSTSLYYG